MIFRERLLENHVFSVIRCIRDGTYDHSIRLHGRLITLPLPSRLAAYSLHPGMFRNGALAVSYACIPYYLLNPT